MIDSEKLKAEAAAHIAFRLRNNDRDVSFLRPILDDGPTRDLIILFMCGFAAQIVEDELREVIGEPSP